jgi:ribonucleoside-diphosphate reductase alpha chain
MTGKTDSLCVKDFLQHNVSNTINVKPEEWEDVEKFIYKNRKFFCGVSLLPVSGDKDYPQAPFTTVYLPSEMVSHYGDGAVFVSGLIEVALNLWEDNLWAACDSLLGLGVKVKGNGKKTWTDRCQRFADKYMDGDIKRLSYCMKDVYNWKEWVDIKRSYASVDYTTCIEEHDNTKLEQELACAGGTCEII